VIFIKYKITIKPTHGGYSWVA